MNQLKSYLIKEFNKLPFNLFQIISDYVSQNESIKVAFIGGYIRDLLIKKIHNIEISKSIDLDIVIEGSSISLAQFIKKNVSNVQLCLIKEFELYNTVEIFIDEFKIDIASARKEIYKSPGLNPEIEDSTIQDDLKRRDFSINAIAYEISERELIDLHNGLEHIQNKELNLLHDKSIYDDPSRLLRCAKYASRLNFKISRDSLIQSKKAILEWPWVNSGKPPHIKFPPGISIRIRMELSEICKYDNLSSIIYQLDTWGLISLISKDINVNKKYLRGISWIKKIDSNPILYLLKDSKSLEIDCERFFINSKEKEILNKFLKYKAIFNNNNFDDYSPSNWTELIEENNLGTECVKLLICDGVKYWRNILRWLLKYRFIKSIKTGEDLKKEGWLSGKSMGDEIRRLRYEEIDNFKIN